MTHKGGKGLLAGVATKLLRLFVGSKGRDIMKRIGKLPTRDKLDLAKALMRDSRIPFGLRAMPFLLVMYLALPFDLVPDFVPVLGQLDDIVVILVGLGMMSRFAPLDLLERHVAEQERLAKEEKARGKT